MAYDRFESRRGWREPRSRYSRDHGDRFEGRGFDRDDDDRGERGFFERAGDEVASWFGDDEAERRRREDMRFRGEDDSWRRPRAFMGDEELGRQARFRDEGYRRPYTGRFTGRRPFGGGDDDRVDRGFSPERGWSERSERSPQREFGQREFGQREFTGMAAGGLHDPHYSEWRRRQIDALDRDYDEYRRENQSRFENEFSNWRTTREGKRQILGEVREHMNVVGSDEEHVGTVDCIRGDRIVLTKSDSPDDRHHSLSCAHIDRIDGDRVILDEPAAEAKRQWTQEYEGRGFFRDEQEEERGPHMLNRSFSGTDER
jgi:hypothetical protein